MIGQKDLLDKIQQQIENEVFPSFAIFIGSKGSGKKTLMKEVADMLEGYQLHELADVKIDTIRDMIEEANTKARAGAKIVYIIPDSENMSLTAKNSILKIVEEPPKGAIFLMSVSTEEELLPTIKNRGALYYMRPYSKQEKQEYLDSLGSSPNAQDLNFILEVSSNLYEINMLLKSHPGELYSFIDKLINSLVKDSVGKLLESAKSIAFKPDDENGYNLVLFWRMCCYVLGDKIRNEKAGTVESLIYRDLIVNTTEKIGLIKFTTISKEHTYDMWILDCRKIVKKWRENGSK